MSELQVFVRLLMSETAIAIANSPGTQSMATLAHSTNVSLQLADPGDYFPNTMDRCILVGGSDSAVITFLWNLSVRVPEFSSPLTLVVPDSCASTIIGQGGSTIKSLQQMSGCRIKVEDRMPGVKDRLVRVAGSSLEIIFRGLRCILDRIQGDPSLRTPPPISFRDQYRMDPAVYQQYLQEYWSSVVQSFPNQQ